MGKQRDNVFVWISPLYAVSPNVIFERIMISGDRLSQ